MTKIEMKHFGQISVHSYASGDGPQLPGVSVSFGDDYRIPDECEGEWIRLKEAKKVVREMTRAIAYVEKYHKKNPKAPS